jgi:serine/threonine protein kinase
MAPEVLSGKNTSAEPALDIFSLGVILYALVIGKLPFDGADHSSIKQKIISGDYHYSSSVSNKCKDLIDSMLRTDPKERI